MTPNPLLKALGLPDNDRAVLIHTDDIGMCHASLAAYADLSQSGTISAGSVMVPCPWFMATAQYCREHPDTTDMGVHVTLTSEWHSGYRWGPVSTRDPASGLLDAEGYLPHTSAETQQSAQPEAVYREIESQLQRALDAGIDVTHMDTHMGTAFFPGFVESYIQVAIEHRIPPFLVRNVDLALQRTGLEYDHATELRCFVDSLQERGLPMFDDVRYVSFDRPESHFDQAKRVLDDLQSGLSYLIIHPSVDTPELRAILPDGWKARAADYAVFMQEEMRTALADRGIHIVTWRTLRDLMRAKL